MSDLFEIQESLSPRLIWLREHSLTLTHVAASKWECALDEENVARGETADEACIQFCLQTSLPHWNQI